MSETHSVPSAHNFKSEDAARDDPNLVAKLQQAANLANKNCDRATVLAHRHPNCRQETLDEPAAFRCGVRECSTSAVMASMSAAIPLSKSEDLIVVDDTHSVNGEIERQSLWGIGGDYLRYPTEPLIVEMLPRLNLY